MRTYFPEATKDTYLPYIPSMIFPDISTWLIDGCAGPRSSCVPGSTTRPSWTRRRPGCLIDLFERQRSIPAVLRHLATPVPAAGVGANPLGTLVD
jgi:hypothetical protein